MLGVDEAEFMVALLGRCRRAVVFVIEKRDDQNAFADDCCAVKKKTSSKGLYGDFIFRGRMK